MTKKNNRFLKSVLTSTALVATMFAAESAMAAAVINTDGNVDINANVVAAAAGNGLDAVFADGSVIKMDAAARTIAANSADAVFGVDLNTKNPGVTTITKNSTLIGVYNAAAGNGLEVNFGADNATLTLNGAGAVGVNAAYTAGNYSGLKTIDFKNKAGAVNVTKNDLDLSGVTILSTGGVAGAVNVNATGTKLVKLDAANGIATLNIGQAGAAASATTSSSIYAANTAINTGSTLNVADAHNINGSVEGGVGAYAGNAAAFAANRGTLVFAGASKVTGTIGANGSLAEVQTGVKLVTLQGAASTKKLTIGTGGITTNSNVTVGADGIRAAAAANLTFTAAANLALTNAANNFEMVDAETTLVAPTGANALTVKADGNFNSIINGAIKAGDANSLLTFTAANGGANSYVTVNADIGTSDVKFDTIALTAANDRLVLGEGVTAYAKTLTAGNADSDLRLSKNASFTGTHKGTGIITVLGDGASIGILNTNNGGAALAALNFDATASNAGFTSMLDATNANSGIAAITALNFKNATAGDASTFTIDMNGVANTYTTTKLATTVTVSATKGGQIIFANNTNKAAVELNAAGAWGAAANSLMLVDTGGAPTKLTGGNAIYTQALKSGEVTFQSGAGQTLGVYTLADGAPTSFVIADAQSYTIADSSVISSADAPVATRFAAAGTLVLSDKVNYHGSVTQNVGGNGTGIVEVGGDSTIAVDTFGGSTNPLSNINIKSAAGKTVSITTLGGKAGDIFVDKAAGNGLVLVNGKATATTTVNLAANLHSNIVAGADGLGIINLQDGANIGGSLGVQGANGVAEVDVNTTGIVKVGSDSSVAARSYRAATTKFLKDGTLDLSNLTTTADLGTVITNTTNTGKIIAPAQNTATAAVWGTKANPLKEYQLTGNKTFTVNQDVNITNITTDTNLQNNVTIAGAAADSTTTTIGTAGGNRVNVVTAGANATVKAIYAQSIVAGAGTLTATTFDASDATNGVQITNVAGGITVLDGGSVGLITSTAAGTVTAAGNATLSGNVGSKANLVTLSLNGTSADKLVTFKGDTLNANLTQAQATLALTQDTVIAGTSGFTGSTLNLGAKKLTTGDTTFNGNSTIKFAYDAAKKSVVTTSGTATVGNNAVINLEMEVGLPDTGTELVVFASDAGVLTALTGGNDKSVAFTKSGFTTGVYSHATNSVKLTTSVAAADLVSSNVTDQNVLTFVDTISKGVNKGGLDNAAKSFALELAKVSNAGGVTATTEMLQRVTDRSDAGLAQSCAMEAAAAVQNTVSSTANNRIALGASAPAVGVAAGNEAEKFGVWAQVTGGKADQKLRKATAGFKSNNAGVVLGVDTKLSDASTFGIMVGNSQNNMKFKDAKAGDKLKANSWLFGAYVDHQFDNNWFAQGNAAVAQTNASSKAKRSVAGGSQTASAKYDVTTYGIEARGGYRFQFENSSLVPTVGLRYNYFGDASYTEKGTTSQNLKVNAKSSGSVSAVAGVRLGTAADMNGTIILPEVHMNVDYAFSKAAPKADFNLDGSSVKFAYKGSKAAKFGYNFGASISTQSDNVEYGVGYDANIADKYLGHQGSLKVRASF